MANVHETVAQAAGRARTVISRAKRKGEELATEFAKTPAVRQARKKVARVRRQAAVLASKVTDKVTGRAQKRKRRAKAAAAVIGAAAMATAAGIGMARRRKR
jgi:hypothetical protein